MLILTREVGQSIVIGEDIKITILRVDGAQVRLGADAPQDVPVNREEILNREPPNDRSSPEFDFV